MADQLVPQYNTTKGSIYLVELEAPFERIEFQFVPENLNLRRNSRLTPIQVVGRNHDQNQWTGGNDKLSFTLDFYADDMNRRDVMEQINWLRSLTFSKVRKVKIIWGGIFQDETWIVENVDANISRFMSNFSLRPQQAIVNISLRLDPDDQILFESLRL